MNDKQFKTFVHFIFYGIAIVWWFIGKELFGSTASVYLAVGNMLGITCVNSINFCINNRRNDL